MPRTARGLSGLSPLERHVSFFDPDADGQIALGQTYAGLRRLGVGAPLAVVLSLIINFALGKLTQGHFSMTVSVRNIAEGLHAYDTGVFQPKTGAADLGVLDAIFREAGFSGAPGPKDAITKAELDRHIRARGDQGRPFAGLGRWFSARETQLLVCLAADAEKVVDGERQPAITRRQIRRLYSGKLLYLLERRRRIRTARGA